MSGDSWLLLLYGLPSQNTAGRVGLWRKLKKFGAIQLKTSAYLLPDVPAHYERFQWLAKQVRDGGGEATLMQVKKIEGLSTQQIIGLFNKARAKDYETIADDLQALLRKNGKKRDDEFENEIEKLNRRFQELAEIDYFSCPAAHDVEMALQRAAGQSAGTNKKILSPRHFSGKTWLTRPRPEIDRVASAWLIKRFIDPKATFVFALRPEDHPDAIPFDMATGEFTHHGDCCTFETLLKRFAIANKSLQKIAEAVHDADLEDARFQRQECVGVDRILKGMAKLGLADDELLKRGGDCFDALHEYFKK